mmetsp:Transcript_31822/g.101787  ORF Transcript_31822/g.101787 Transcript_31822/m.101787 type:complete len:145 (+) Transcript_31822:28-462(+)
MSSALVALVIGWSPTRCYAPDVAPRAVVRAQPIQLMLQPPKMPWEDFEMPELPKMPWDSGGEDAGEAVARFGWLNLDPHLPLPDLEGLRGGRKLVNPDYLGRRIYLALDKDKKAPCQRSDEFSNYFGEAVYVCDGGKGEGRRIE